MAVKYANEYKRLFETMKIKAEKLAEVDKAVSKINAGKGRYQALEKITGVPWFFIGMLHYMEAGNNFSEHLHNGDPLTNRTVNVPAGRPVFNPKNGAVKPSHSNPYTFEESAFDAINFMNATNPAWKAAKGDWSIEAMLYRMEAFNGFGYRSSKINIPTPYLWSYSNHYVKGKYVADKVYDANAVSKQAGTAVILYRVLEKNDLLKKIIGGAAAGAGVLLLCAAVFF